MSISHIPPSFQHNSFDRISDYVHRLYYEEEKEKTRQLLELILSKIENEKERLINITIGPKNQRIIDDRI